MAELRRSLRDLETLMPAMESVACVPVGLTRYREGLAPLRMFTPEEAAAVIDLAEETESAAEKRLPSGVSRRRVLYQGGAPPSRRGNFMENSPS